MPKWVGDIVMATPVLRALRERFSEAHITAAIGAGSLDLLHPCPWLDHLLPLPKSVITAAVTLRRGRFDTALVLPNSFRSALVTRLAGIEQRIGYKRDGRSWLLTQGLTPQRLADGAWKPVPMVDYYLQLAQEIGVQESASRSIELRTNQQDQSAADELLKRGGVEAQTESSPASGQHAQNGFTTDGRPIVLFNPGAANRGDTKLWPAERYGSLARHLIEKHNAVILVNGSPAERQVIDRVRAAADNKPIDLPALGSGLRSIKPIAKRCALAVSNDSGGRHIALAMGTPTISLFGPTDPEWTRLDLPHETVITAADGRMDSIAVEAVASVADRLLSTSLTIQSSQAPEGAS